MFTKATFLTIVADTSFKPTNSKKTMRYPNTRYGNPVEFQYYTQGQPVGEIAKRLKRDKRTVQRWFNGKQKIPWWIPEILRLQRLEYDLWMHQTAEAHAKALAEAMNTELVKKSDLNEFRTEVKGQFELLKWMLGFMLAGTVAILFKIFH